MSRRSAVVQLPYWKSLDHERIVDAVQRVDLIDKSGAMVKKELLQVPVTTIFHDHEKLPFEKKEAKVDLILI